MSKVIYWFRTDLRLHDSPALAAALDLNPECLWPIWTWDPHYVFNSRVSPNRWQFLLDCQSELSKHITEVNPKSKLYVLREAPQTLFPKLFKHWKVTHLVFEKDVDAYARERDQKIIAEAEKAGVKVITVTGRTLWDSDEIVKQNNDEPTMSIKQLEAAAASLGEPPKPTETPRKLPNPGDTRVNFDQTKPDGNSKNDLNKHIRESEESSFAKIAGPKGDFAVPTLEELGIDPKSATTNIRGGEKTALKQLDSLLEDADYITSFEKPKTAPTQFDPPATTRLSPHFHFGSIGIREVYWRIKDLEKKRKNHTKPPASIIGQLLFREMYFGAIAKIGKEFLQTMGNAHTRFIPWRLRSKNSKDKEAQEWLKKWSSGQTGFPWIDAAMRQLKQEGWIHHLARHAVACFLTRGGCFIAWERGMEVFEEHLLDHEPACNSGNWQWLACTAFYAMFYRVYSPVSFAQKWDKNGDYIRKYVPELKDVPTKFIYEPWKAPKDSKPKNYPEPMFDFNERRQICMDAMKAAYDEGKYGNDIDSYEDDASGVKEGSEVESDEDNADGDNATGEGKETKDKKNKDEREQKRPSKRRKTKK